MLNKAVRQARNNIRESVERGAALLDQRHPRWFKKIDLDAFDLASGSYCICGQLDSLYNGCEADSGNGLWSRALDRLFGRKNVEDGSRPEKYGFIVDHTNDIEGAGWSYAEDVWKREIRKRRRKAQQAMLAA